MNIQVSIKSVYGKNTIYPVCEQAKLFAKLVGQKTLTKRDLETIALLGYSIKVVLSNGIKVTGIALA